MIKNLTYLFLFVLTLSILSCGNEKLPVLGRKEYDPDTKDSVEHAIGKFYFINQNEDAITDEYLKGNITVAYFFFTTCPSICPIMTDNMKYVQEKTKDFDIQILAHTVDPKTDTIEKLKAYIERNKINTNNWDFLTGDQDHLYEVGVQDYMVATQEDVDALGGFLHSENFVLVDKDLHIRGFYNGTDKEEIEQLIKDIPKLINEYKN